MFSTLNLLLLKPYKNVISPTMLNSFLQKQDDSLSLIIHSRVSYIFVKLKEITESSIHNFNYLNSYDNENNLGFFEINSENHSIEFCGDFTDKYSKPFGFSFPEKFLFIDFEHPAEDIYKQFLSEKKILEEICSSIDEEHHQHFREYSFSDSISKI